MWVGCPTKAKDGMELHDRQGGWSRKESESVRVRVEEDWVRGRDAPRRHKTAQSDMMAYGR